jgi:hypothetical protein
MQTRYTDKRLEMRQSLLAAMATVDLLMASYTYNKLIAS